MKRVMFAAALALAAFSFAPVLSSAAHAYDAASVKPRIDIPRIKSVLQLTPEQRAYWPPVEAALRSIARQQVKESDANLFLPIGHITSTCRSDRET